MQQQIDDLSDLEMYRTRGGSRGEISTPKIEKTSFFVKFFFLGIWRKEKGTKNVNNF